MNALIDLNIKSYNNNNNNNISNELLNTVLVNQLKQLGLNLHKLKRLSLILFGENVKQLIIETINQNFKQLKRLEINGYFPKDYVLMSESLNRCKRLTHLTLQNKHEFEIKEIFFKDIDKHLPKLQYLKIRDADLTDKALNSLTKLTKLQTFRLLYNINENITESGVNYLMENCPKIIQIFVNYS